MDASFLVGVALLGLACGVAGGYGGRRLAQWSLLARLAALEEVVAVFDTRLRRREGQAGASARDAAREGREAAQLEMAKIITQWPALKAPAPASGEAPKDRNAILRLALAQRGAAPAPPAPPHEE